jgi:sialic acid synthase SpsE
LVANRDIKKGQILTNELVGLMRPLEPYGLSPDFYEEIIGKKASREIARHDPITLDVIDFSN